MDQSIKGSLETGRSKVWASTTGRTAQVMKASGTLIK